MSNHEFIVVKLCSKFINFRDTAGLISPQNKAVNISDLYWLANAKSAKVMWLHTLCFGYKL